MGDARDSKTQGVVVGMLATLPCLAFAIVSAWWFAAGLAGGGLWPADRVTLAEAIATRNNAEALRLIGLGANPNQPSHVREGLLTGGYDVVVTPVEAAVGAQRADTLKMLLENGVIVDARELLVLRCYERARRDSGVRDILDAQVPGVSDDARGASQAEPDCTGVHLPSERRVN